MNKLLTALVVFQALLCCCVEGATRIVTISDPQGSSVAAYVNTNSLNIIITSILALNPRPDAVTVSGDMIHHTVNPDNSYLQFTNCMNRLVTNGIPYYCSMGNHTVSTDLDPLWYTKWLTAFPDFPGNGPTNWLKLAYYIDIGAARIIVLDCISGGTNWIDTGSGPRYRIDGGQAEWLKSVIGTNSPQPFDIVIAHAAAYPVTVHHEITSLNMWPSNRDAFVQVLVDAKATAYLVGHEHMYSLREMDTRYNPNWICTVPQIMNVAGAGFYMDPNSDVPPPDAEVMSVYCFGVIDLDPATGIGTDTTLSQNGSSILGQVTLKGKGCGLTVSFMNSVVPENAGTLTNWGRVSARGTVLSNTVVVLQSSDSSEILVTNSVTIPAGFASAPFDMTVLNDGLYDGLQTVAVMAHTDGVADGTGVVSVADVGGGYALLVPPSSAWKYLDDGSDQGTAWRTISFNVSEWAAGPAELGYGDGNEATVVSFGGNPSNKFVTTYFRRTFELSGPIGISNLTMRLLRDDGAVVYLNGTEILRDNMPAGPIDWQTLATSAIQVTNYIQATLDPSFLTNGTNVVAVEIHQCAVTSPDISFDLNMTGTMYPRANFEVPSVLNRFQLEAANTNLDGNYTVSCAGCAIAPNTQELLVILTNTPNLTPAIQVYDLDGTYKRCIELTDFENAASICQYDPEHGRFAVLEKGLGDITVITVTTNSSISKLDGEVIHSGLANAANNGLDGVTYDRANNCFYVTKDKNPMGVYRVQKIPSGDVVTEMLFDAGKVFAYTATDLSDLTYDPLSGHLWILSGEIGYAFECNMAGNIIAELSIGGTQPEGITFSVDNSTMYIVGEPNEYYRYSLPRLTGSGEETNTPLNLAVTLSSPMPFPVSVGYTITSSTARVGEDYNPASGTITFPPGSTREILSAGIVTDDIPEPAEMIRIALTNDANCRVARDSIYEHTILADKVRLEVRSDIRSCQPPAGTNLIAYGTLVRCSVTNTPVYEGALATQYVCVGWTGAGNVPPGGAGTNTTDFTLTNHSSIVWNWQTNFYLDTGMNGSGTVSVADGWFKAGSNVVVTATPAAHYHFANWSGTTNGCTISTNSITVLMNAPRTITANFALDTHTLTVTSAHNGAIPPVGVYSNDYGTVLTCSVTNSPVFDGLLFTQYVCVGWTGTGSAPANGSGTNVTLTLTNNSSITWNWQGQFPSLLLSFSNSIVSEGDGVLINWGRVGAGGILLSNLTVSLVSDDASEVTVPGSVVIPAGSASAPFNMTVVDDVITDGMQIAKISASATSFIPATNSITVRDNEIDHFFFAAITSPKTSGIPFSVTITARDASNNTVTAYSGNAGLTGAGTNGAVSVMPAGIVLTNGQWTGNATVIGSDTGVRLGADDGLGHSGTSNPFDTQSIPLHHFAWGPISTQQCMTVPFVVTITAKSTNNVTVPDFTGKVALTGWVDLPDVTIGNGTTTDVYPMGAVNADSRDQAIYLASSIGGARRITALSLDVTTVPGQMLGNWTIRMKQTSLTNYPGSPAWDGSGWIVVYQNNETVSSTGWKKFTFAVPFNHNGVDNVMVDYSFNNTTFSSSGRCRYTTATGTRQIYFRTNNGYGDPLLWTGTNNPVPTASLRYPNVMLSARNAVALAPTVTVAFVAGVWTGNITVNESTTSMFITADDGSGHTGNSGLFNTAVARTLAVQSLYGGAVPPVGTNTYPGGTVLSCGVTNSPVFNGAFLTQYVCAGWTGNGSVPSNGSGTNTTFTLTANSAIAWNWSTNYWLAVASNGHGAVADASGWRAAGSNETVPAQPDQYYHFQAWTGDVGAGNTNSASITVTMDRPRSLTAIFNANMATNLTPEWWLAQFYGNTNNFDGLALGDSDGDRMPAWKEYRAGTDPANGQSVLRILNASPDATGGVQVYWSSVTNRIYSVYKCTNISRGWIAPQMTSGIPGNPSGTNSCRDTVSGARDAYYRIGVD